MFERSEVGPWGQVKVTASDADVGDRFGGSVAISGDRLVVGAPEDDDGGDGAGAAYVFERSDVGQWEQAKVTASDAGAGARFGSSVAISGDYLVVGAEGDHDLGISAGAAYVFHFDRDASQWDQVRKLTAEDGEGGDCFGFSMAMSGDYLVVGAYGNDGGAGGAGAAYVFERPEVGPWGQVKVTAGDAVAGANFGFAVAISGDHLVAGAWGDDERGSLAGAAYVFERSDVAQWEQLRKVVASDGDDFDEFGGSVAISNSHLAVGASARNSHRGACYVF